MSGWCAAGESSVIGLLGKVIAPHIHDWCSFIYVVIHMETIHMDGLGFTTYMSFIGSWAACSKYFNAVMWRCSTLTRDVLCFNRRPLVQTSMLDDFGPESIKYSFTASGLLVCNYPLMDILRSKSEKYFIYKDKISNILFSVSSTWRDLVPW